MDGQTLTSLEWDNPAEPLRIYGEVVRLHVYPPPELRGPCCNMQDDLVMQAPPVMPGYLELRFRLMQFYEETLGQWGQTRIRYFWRYVRV